MHVIAHRSYSGNKAITLGSLIYTIHITAYVHIR
jgi:hypothetical protein